MREPAVRPRVARRLAPALAGCVVAALAGTMLHGRFDWAVAAVCLLAAWIVLAGLRDVYDKTRHRGLAKGLPLLGRSYWGMHLAHLGFAMCALGAVLTSIGNLERDLRMAPGDVVELGGYRFVFEGTTKIQGPNYTADRGGMSVMRNGREVARLHPEKRVYQVQQATMTEAGIQGGFTRDLFVALGEPLADGAWAVRVHIKPFVRWIWLGALLMALGGFLAAADRRYRPRPAVRPAQAASIAGMQS